MTDQKMKDCREAFETWYATPGCPSIERSDDGYKLMQAHQAWIAWQAPKTTRADLTALQPQPAHNPWQPIESAPRDGTQVLVWSDELYIKPYIAWWGVDQNAPEDGNEQEEWLTGDGDSWSTGYYYTPCNPTHWMPLPAPPQTEKENG